MAMYSSEVTPSVWTSTASTSSPVAKPITAPVSDPASSPTDMTMSGVRSALIPKMEICDTAASWMTTVPRASRTRRRISRGAGTLIRTSARPRVRRPLGIPPRLSGRRPRHPAGSLEWRADESSGWHLGPDVGGVRPGEDLHRAEVAKIGGGRDRNLVAVVQLVRVDVAHGADGKPGRVQRGQRAGLEAGGDHQVALGHLSAPGEILEQKLVGVAHRRGQDPGVAGVVGDLSGGAVAGSGDEGDDRHRRVDGLHIAHQAAVGQHRVALLDALVRTGVDLD